MLESLGGGGSDLGSFSYLRGGHFRFHTLVANIFIAMFVPKLNWPAQWKTEVLLPALFGS